MNKEKLLRKVNLEDCIIAILFFIIASIIVYNNYAGTIYSVEAIQTTSVTIPHKQTEAIKTVQKEYIGKGSWYNYSLKGQPDYGKSHATCASRTLKRYSTAKITNLANGKSIVCYVNDYVENPKVEIDLSQYAFSQIANLSVGIINIKIEDYTNK